MKVASSKGHDKPNHLICLLIIILSCIINVFTPLGTGTSPFKSQRISIHITGTRQWKNNRQWHSEVTVISSRKWLYTYCRINNESVFSKNNKGIRTPFVYVKKTAMFLKSRGKISVYAKQLVLSMYPVFKTMNSLEYPYLPYVESAMYYIGCLASCSWTESMEKHIVSSVFLLSLKIHRCVKLEIMKIDKL